MARTTASHVSVSAEVELALLRVEREANSLKHTPVPQKRVVVPFTRNKDHSVDFERASIIGENRQRDLFEASVDQPVSRRQTNRLTVAIEQRELRGDFSIQDRPGSSRVEFGE